MEKKKIEEGDLVTVHVTVWDLQGNVVDETGEEGVTLRAGNEDVFPRMDQELLKHKDGDRFDLVLEPEESFGDFDENLVYLVPAERLGVKEPRKGMRFAHIPGVPADGGRGYIVTDIGDGMAVLDGNHPYAGWTLRFEITVLRVETVEDGDVNESDFFIPDFLRVANEKVKEEAEDRLEVDEARRKLAEEEEREAKREEMEKPAEALGTGLFTSFIPKKGN
ncbi:MAG: FKBP-type peptidyl-prolyl cis-trans isomerase [Sutterellaceae bacterium]|nr:FKBP-type peptidyl-prolyl cis-trans isomerase [Sutterellaceae bacterium]MDD7442736.1 FKBP-type peptidyl-prolyl cis-trans isomerase [Sutterellaceae bacterium]MDY2867304.1 FKBP-type peptidyl-prolyl cis-trans isomerase [Mesosutterella sp.]